jgi:hypothetical protein
MSHVESVGEGKEGRREGSDKNTKTKRENKAGFFGALTFPSFLVPSLQQ